jgi:methionyl-tRNA formyltransferase
MDAGLDTGPMLAQRTYAITEQDDAQSLHDRLAELGAELLASVLETIAAGTAHETPQPAEGATYAPKIQDSETRIDWSKSAVEIERAIRAFRPAPGAQTELRGSRCKIWSARVVKDQGEPGMIIAAGGHGIRVACGQDALDIFELQRAGGRRLRADEFLRGFPLSAGERLANPG